MTLADEARRAPASAVEAAARALHVSARPGSSAFVARGLNALVELAGRLDDRAMAAAAGASSDLDVLLRAMGDPRALGSIDDPFAGARLRGVSAAEALLAAEGGVLPVERVAALLRITRQAVDKRRRAGRLIGLDTGRRGYAYPTWQFAPAGGLLPGLEAVLAELADEDAWMRAAFMLGPDSRLDGESPLSALRRGETEAVRAAARSYGQQGAD
jgi:hypothetical protein